jgi:hypothetical protein
MTEWGIDTLFNPGKRHMDEEKRRLQSTREEVGDSSGGRRIDLESGTVRISRGPKDRSPAADDGEDGGAEVAADTVDTEPHETDAKDDTDVRDADEDDTDVRAAEAGRSTAQE